MKWIKVIYLKKRFLLGDSEIWLRVEWARKESYFLPKRFERS